MTCVIHPYNSSFGDEFFAYQKPENGLPQQLHGVVIEERKPEPLDPYLLFLVKELPQNSLPQINQSSFERAYIDPKPPKLSSEKIKVNKLNIDFGGVLEANNVKKQRTLLAIAGVLALIGFALLAGGAISLAAGSAMVVSSPLFILGGIFSLASGVIAGIGAYRHQRQH